MKYFLFSFLIISAFVVKAQVGVSIGTATPHASAMLDVTSTDRGLLPPRMDSTQRNAILSPAEGLTIYNTDLHAFQCFNGTRWYSTVHYIGENYMGGIVCHVYDNGQHGLIAALNDLSPGMRWFAGTNLVCMTQASGVGGGRTNTSNILVIQGVGDGDYYAARICNEYNVSVDGQLYGGWYLPSKYEIYYLYLNKNIIGGFTSGPYWSSTETLLDRAWLLDFNGNGFYESDKSNLYPVRAIRAF